MHAHERGFTIVEVLIAGAIITLMALSGLAACQAIARVTTATYSASHGFAAMDAQAAQLRNDAASAFAVFVPPTDIHGAANSAPGGAHEVDFYSRGDASKGDAAQDFVWCYYYDAARQTLQRFDEDPDGARGVRDVTTGRINSVAAYPALKAITAFSAETLTADQLGDAGRNVYSGVAALLSRAPRAFSVSYDHPGLGMPAAAGGNAIVQVTLATTAGIRVVHLAAATLPTGFTVTGLPRWHAVLYRVDQTHRTWFGVAGKSHVFINARVDVTYDGWQHRTTWCDYNVYGNPDGLDGHDPHADYKPDEPPEQAEALLAGCRTLSPTPPPRGASDSPAQPGVVTQPLPVPTPPACWTSPGVAGRCWPADAPVDWTPPSPLPRDTPPPPWCRTHAQSTACSTASAPE